MGTAASTANTQVQTTNIANEFSVSSSHQFPQYFPNRNLREPFINTTAPLKPINAETLIEKTNEESITQEFPQTETASNLQPQNSSQKSSTTENSEVTEKEELKKDQENGSSNKLQTGNDAYKWRKYGSKKAKGSNRAYYKCRHPNCIVKKITETTTGDGTISHFYKGEHNHPPPSVFFYSAADVFDFKDIQNQINSNEAINQIEHPKVIVTVNIEINPCEDGFSWRKYGQKMVKGNPRSYYKCTNQTCPVKKQIERCTDRHVCTYEDLHNHTISDNSNSLSSHSDPSVGTKRMRTGQVEWESRKECKSDPEFYVETDSDGLPGLGNGNTRTHKDQPNQQILPNFSSFTSQITNGNNTHDQW